MTNPNADCPPHPKYGKPLSGKPLTVDGVIFRPYRAGILQYTFVSDDFEIEVRLVGSWYRYILNETIAAQKFRNKDRACLVAVAERKKLARAA